MFCVSHMLCFCWLFTQTTPPGLYSGLSVAIINTILWNVNLLAVGFVSVGCLHRLLQGLLHYHRY